MKRDFTDALIVLGMIAVIAYAITRSVLFLFAEYTPIEKVFAVMLISGELFVLLHGFGYVLNIFRVVKAGKNKRTPKGEAEDFIKAKPHVVVVVAARHEPREVLERTFITLNNLDYTNKTICLLDDSTEDRYMAEADELARELDLKIFRRQKRKGGKAGILNDFLAQLDAKYLAVFDADQNPLPDFLKAIVPIMERDERLAFVQTPQFYTNIESSHVARGAAFQQDVFYEYICEGKSAKDAMFCCGTNIVFRKEALDDVGGFDESTVTEDFATSIKLHANGWKSLYFNHVYAFGMGPENISAYLKQQFRWSTGTLSAFKKLIWRFFTRPFSLRPSQWWEYLLSSSYYLIGIAFFVLMICPIVYLFFEVPSFFTRPEVYFLAFVPYILLSVSIFYHILGKRNYKGKDLLLGQLLGLCAFPTYIRGAISALFGFKVEFGITEKQTGRSIPYWKLWPQLSFMCINLAAVTWGVNRFIFEKEPALLVNSFWVLYHFAAFSCIFYFNQESK